MDESIATTTQTTTNQQEQNQHAAAQLGQYQQHQQQIQSTAHHNSAAAAAAYYQQQAHLYPTYQAHAHSQQDQQQQQQQQQHSGTPEHHHHANQHHHHANQHHHQANQHHHHHANQHHHHANATVPSTVATSSVVTAAVAAAAVAAQQQHVHHQQAATNTQASALNNVGWSPAGVGSMAPQAHHAVVTDHSTLAYMTHAYQSHNTSVSDHHRNSNGPMSTQPIGTGPQASSYTVDNLYNTPAAAAAAAAAYGYNNYNAAFFQTSNNGPHTQTGHPSPANISTFWNHSQAAPQHRTPHAAQAVTNQGPAQQRQTITSEQTANYMHDPRIYYGRPAYGQGMQNFGQAQHHSQTQSQADVIHHRMGIAQQQQQLLQHHEQQLHQVTHHHQQQQQIQHQSSLGNQHQPSSNQNLQTLLNQQHSMHQNQMAANQASVPAAISQNNKLLSGKPSSFHQITKQTSNENDNLVKPAGQVKNQVEFDKISPQSKITSQQTTQSAQQAPQQSLNSKDTMVSSEQNSQIAIGIAKEPIQSTQQQKQQTASSLSPVSKPIKSQAVIKNDQPPQYQRKTQADVSSQAQGRNIYRGPHDDRNRTQQAEFAKKTDNERESRIQSSVESRVVKSPPESRQQDSDQAPSLEDNMASLSIGASRKTTWASIASQPAKVSQPKSLKSKIAGSNSVLSSAKHLAAVSLDSSNLESKNGINPAIKSSVSAAATSIQRSSVPPPISKLPAVAASLKLDLLGEEGLESSRISWPAVNASINLSLDDPPPKPQQKDSNATNNSLLGSNYNSNENQKKDDGYRSRDYRDSVYKDHNHNQGSNAKMVNSYSKSIHAPPNRDFWTRREQRDHRVRRDSDRKEPDHERQLEHHDEPREPMRRDFKPAGNPRINHFRGDDHYRDREFNKRGAIPDRNEQRNNDGYQNSNRFPNNRFEPRDFHQQHNNQSQHGGRHNDNQQTQHHHYNNVKDGNVAGNSLSKLDLTLHPHLNPANFNPKTFDLEPKNARYFIIKSYSEDDIHRSIKYSIWCSTNHGNKRLDEAYRQQQEFTEGPIYLFFSVNSSGHFCGMAQMMSSVDFDSSSGVWAQSKWQGEFSVKWIYVKDVPNGALRHITLENNENKPVTNSRDTQEVPSEKGKAVLKILHQFPHKTSIFDDFLHYERRQEEEKFKKSHIDSPSNRSDEREPVERGISGGSGGGGGGGGGSARFGRPYVRPHNDFPDRNRERRFAS